MSVRFATTLLVGVAFCSAIALDQDDRGSDVEALRDRVEALRSEPHPQVRGETIAATSLIADFYEHRGFRPAWSDPAHQQALARAINGAERDGLDPRDYHRDALAKPAGPDEGLDLELLRTDALIRLGYHILFGKVDAASFDPNWNYERVIPDFEPVRELERIVDAPDLEAELERAKPTHPIYAGLRDALARYRAIRGAGGWPRVGTGGALRPGDSDPRIRELRVRLKVTGELAADAGEESTDQYDDALVDAVRRFQESHGLQADGVVGPRTIEELNVSVDDRIDQLRVNLDRGRWLLHDLGGTFVIVNVAGYRLYYVRDGKVDWETRVQVGKPFRATPVFRSEITYLVLNPTWTVPPGILRNDILPAQRRDPATLQRKGLKIYNASGREISPSAVDWQSRSFPYTLRQDPGPSNALGRVKFMFPNAHAVYLHDTPSKNLFDADDRAFSSGCIRVEDPMALAERLLAEQKDWTRADIDRAVAQGKTRTVTLAQPVPVLLSYWTAWVDRSGEVQFRADVYGRDTTVLAALDAEFRFSPRNTQRRAAALPAKP